MKKQNVIIVAVVAAVLLASVGYAFFSETIEVKGTATARGNFDVEFSSASIIEETGSAGALVNISDDKNILDITVPKLEYPGSFVEISFTITNKGTIPAQLIKADENIKNDNITITYEGLSENSVLINMIPRILK